MSLLPATQGASALSALLEARDRFGKLADKDFTAATSLLVKKLMTSAGQTTADMTALKEAVGAEIFDTVLKSLTAHQARLLAKRLDKDVDDFEVSTAGAAVAHIRKVMAGAQPAPEADATPEDTAAETPAEGDTPKGTYFGRKSFRSGN